MCYLLDKKEFFITNWTSSYWLFQPTCSGSFCKILSFSASSTRCGMCSKANNGAKLAEAADSCESFHTAAPWSEESVWLYRGKCRPPETRRVPDAEPGTTPCGRPSSKTWEKPASSLKFHILKYYFPRGKITVFSHSYIQLWKNCYANEICIVLQCKCEIVIVVLLALNKS